MRIVTVPGVEIQDRRARRAAMNLHDERITLARLIANRLHQDAFDYLAVARFPLSYFGCTESQIPYLRIRIGQLFPRRTLSSSINRGNGKDIWRYHRVRVVDYNRPCILVLCDRERRLFA